MIFAPIKTLNIEGKGRYFFPFPFLRYILPHTLDILPQTPTDDLIIFPIFVTFFWIRIRQKEVWILNTG